MHRPTTSHIAQPLSGIRISGADPARPLAVRAGVSWGSGPEDAPLRPASPRSAPHRPAPHAVHRPHLCYPDDLPTDELPTGGLLADEPPADEAEPVWEGAARMLHRVSVARRLHPAGRARTATTGGSAQPS